MVWTGGAGYLQLTAGQEFRYQPHQQLTEQLRTHNSRRRGPDPVAPLLNAELALRMLSPCPQINDALETSVEMLGPMSASLSTVRGGVSSLYHHNSL